MNKNSLTIFSFSQGTVSPSSLTEVLNHCKVAIPVDKIGQFYYVTSQVTNIGELLKANSEDNNYIYKSANGALYLCKTLEGFLYSLEQRISEGCAFYIVEEILEDYIDLMVEHLGHKSVQEFIKEIPLEECILVLRDIHTNETLKIRSFNRHNVLNILDDLADMNSIYEVYERDSTKISSILNMPRFVRNIENIKFANIVDKTLQIRNRVYDCNGAKYDGLAEDIGSMSAKEYEVHNIVTHNCKQLELPLYSLTEINQLLLGIKEIVEFVDKDLGQTSDIQLNTVPNDLHISTDPLV